MGARRPPTVCVYCGSNGPLTKDHVPGQGLFSKPLPSTLLTVPSCLKCKSENDLEDEYFRLHVASRVESKSHPEASQAGERSFRRLEHPKSAGFRKTVISSIVNLQKRSTPNGEEMVGTFMVNFHRLNRYAVRTVKALFAHHQGSPVPAEYEVVAFCADMQGFATPAMSARLDRMLAVVRDSEQHSSARKVLRYKFGIFMPDGISSIWGPFFFPTCRFHMRGNSAAVRCLTIRATGRTRCAAARFVRLS